AVIIHLHRVEQTEHRPGARALLDAYASASDLLHHQAGTTFIFLAGPAARRLNDGAMAILHLLVTEWEISTAQMRIQGIRLKLEQNQWLAGVLGEKAAANRQRLTQLGEEGLGQRQHVAVHRPRLVLASGGDHERLDVALEETIGNALWLEEVSEVGKRDVALTGGVERITLVERVMIGLEKLALITLIDVAVGLVQHKHPAIFGHDAKPLTDRLGQSGGIGKGLLDGILAVVHPSLGDLEGSQF